ncbi:hypothetical protein QYF61_003240 [Mycteria americana]|uniref:Uncharacterized protein n=1 Tax=Mycteria americana TaxID=33587 RepID=A0AAN7MZN5_MYCAM|nr:hypothetical protein QYF61_003240 [Mycteria americana]
MSRAKGHKDDEGTGASDIWGEAERAGTTEPAEEEGQGDPAHKKLGGGTARTADPNWPKGYSIPYGVTLSIETGGAGRGAMIAAWDGLGIGQWVITLSSLLLEAPALGKSGVSYRNRCFPLAYQGHTALVRLPVLPSPSGNPCSLLELPFSPRETPAPPEQPWEKRLKRAEVSQRYESGPCDVLAFILFSSLEGEITGIPTPTR